MREKIIEALTKLKKTETGHDKHGNNGYVVLDGKKFFVGLMSYGDWYIAPYLKNRTERTPFPDGTIWLDFDFEEIVEMLKRNKIIRVNVEIL